MSFIQNEPKKPSYAPGWFLAEDEMCIRETRQVDQNSALAKDDGIGGKYVPMGTAYPTNDANAVGILYEDVDVSTGNMPGSVVLKGHVYEDRLAVTGASYSTATVPTGGNPAELGLYERSGSSPNYVYTLTTDTTAAEAKTYYSKTLTRLASAAKTALAALGFTFTTAPAVTRP